MDRRPLWPIAVGLVLWSIVGYVAYTGTWWPLIVIAIVSVVPGIGIGVMALFTRRMKRDANALLEPSAGAAPTSNEPIAEPPKARPSSVRTNARTAGRKRGGGATAVLLFAGVLMTEGCEKIERARAERRAKEAADDGGTPSDSEAAKPTAPAAPAAALASAADRALDAALAIAITPPAAGEASYGVDPFVAALVFERVRLGSLTFTKLDAPIPEGPTAGFRVGEVVPDSLMHRLGLRTGDVIEAIGGVVLSDASRVGFALDGAENRVDVTVFRDGMSLVHSYKLTEGLAWKSVLAGYTGDATIAAVRPTDSDAPPSVAPPVTDADPISPPPSSPGGTRPTTPTTPSTPTTPAKPSSGGGTTPSKPTSGGGSSTPPPASSSVSCESSSKCTVKRAYFDKMVASPNALQSQATIVPAIANDVHSGYKLKTVKSGSAIHQMGFRSGDKITHINGKDLTDEMQAASLYLGMSGISVFKIRYERGGSSQVKTVVVV